MSNIREIPTLPSQADQAEAKAALDGLGPGWRLANVQKGNCIAVRNGQSGEIESQAAASLDGLVLAVELREDVLARTPVVTVVHGGPEADKPTKTSGRKR